MDSKKLTLTKEMKDRLKKSGMIGFSIRSDFLYVPLAFREKDNDGQYIIPKELWTVYKLKGIMGVDDLKIYEDVLSKVELSNEQALIKNSSIALSICKYGILCWKNQYSDNDSIVDFEIDELTKTISDKSLNVLSKELIRELANAIYEHSTLTEDELLGLQF